MTKKTAFLIVAAVLLGALSLYLNRDRFATQPIQISDRSMVPRGRMARRYQDSAADPVVFLINRELRLSSLKVVLASDAATNKYPHALWELVSDSRSAPVHEFVYGANLRGMKPKVKGSLVEPLQPGTRYLLQLQAGSFKAEHAFTPVARAQ
jgi:hypothetical protein